MVKSGFVCFVFMGFVLGTLAAQDQRSAEKSHQVVLKYLGTAGWEITDGTTSRWAEHPVKNHLLIRLASSCRQRIRDY